jgi:hypothetical protein
MKSNKKKRAQWEGFPSTRNDKQWPGEWRYGVDFSRDSGSFRVVAVNVNGSEPKYGLPWVGPIDLGNENQVELLEAWAEATLDTYGGYVHLFPADGEIQLISDEDGFIEQVYPSEQQQQTTNKIGTKPK